MYYQYRWTYTLCVSLALISLGYFYEIQPAFQRLHELENTERVLSWRLHADKKNLKIEKPILIKTKNQFAGLRDLIYRIYENDLSIKSIQYLPMKNTKIDFFPMHFVIEGNIQNLIHFVWSLEDIVSVQNFSFKMTDKHHMVLAIDLWLQYFYNLPYPQNNKNVHTINQFFCSDKNAIFNSSTEVFPLKQMKMVGYFHQGMRRQALVQLPNQTIVRFELGEIIGSERAIISDIQKKYILAKLPNQKITRIEHDISIN